MFQPFNQTPPALGNQFRDDRVLRSYLQRHLSPDVRKAVDPLLDEMGGLAGGDLYQMQLEDRLNEPHLTNWSPWGERIDEISLTPLWQTAEQLAAKYGLVAIPYEKKFGPASRTVQFALAYLFHPSTDVYTCPLAMTDGAARTLQHSGNRILTERAVPHLISRDPEYFWTSGQWMTESTGGSDVGTSETVARQDARGVWRLTGRKWFTSATSSQMALTLARPKGNPAGGKGLALFYVETRDDQGRLRNIHVNRLKDKLGTRKVPTAELILEDTRAELVMGTTDGVANIVPMLHVTRTWNSVMAVAAMRRGLALARDYSRRRVAFGAPLSEKPLHLDTLAGLQAEMEAAFHLSFYLVELMGREEAEALDEAETDLLRLLTSVVKLTTGRQVVAVISEVLECFGGAGYVEDTGLPLLLRDSQVFPIWEGTTNVLSLDTLRALNGARGWNALMKRVKKCLSGLKDERLKQAGAIAGEALAEASRWLSETTKNGAAQLEAGARRVSLTIGRGLALALLVEHAQWSIEHEKDGRARAAALRFARSGINLIADASLIDSRTLANDESCPVG